MTVFHPSDKAISFSALRSSHSVNKPDLEMGHIMVAAKDVTAFDSWDPKRLP